MRLSRRTNTIILWIISIGLMVGMIITFTPTIGGFGGGNANEGRAAILVNGEAISELEVARARQSPLFSSVREGEVGRDLELLLADQLVRQEVFDQAAAKTRVSDREVRQEVDRFRESQGVAGRRNDQAYLQLIGRSGFDDQSFRAYMKEQLRRQKYEESLTEGVEISESEVETYYLANADQYRSEDRIRGRIIVVDEPAVAARLRERVLAGEDFAQLAREHSLERADRGGALGAPAGSSDPQPVGRAALPQAVANAAFGLRGEGLTQVVEAGGRAYLVQVEEYQPERNRPLAEVREQVQEDALETKRAGVVQRHVEQLVSEARVEVPEGSPLEYEDYPVARVGDEAIMASDLALATYSNQQIQQNLNPQMAPLIVDFFKPTILENMIDQKLAYLGASELEGDFVGGEGQVAQQALAFVSRDATIDEGEVAEYYEANRRRFTVPAEANVTRVEFSDQEAAQEFRAALLNGEDAEAAAEASGGEVSNVGKVREGQLEEALDRALFATDAFEELPGGEREVSDVLVVRSAVEQPEGEEQQSEGEEEAEGGVEEAEAQQPQLEETFVVLLAKRTPERMRSLEEVRPQVEQAVLAAEKSELEQQWLSSLREEIEVQNLLGESEAADGGEAGDEQTSEPDQAVEDGGGPETEGSAAAGD